MKVYPINSYSMQNNTKPVFKGDFVQNIDLMKLIEHSNKDSAKRFERITQQIKKIPDNIVFWIGEFYSENDAEKTMDLSYDLFHQTENDKNNKKLMKCFWAKDIPASLRLSKVNEEIEKFYGDKIKLS